MVATRNHPKPFDPPATTQGTTTIPASPVEPSPTKRTTRNSAVAAAAANYVPPPRSPTSPTTASSQTRARTTSRASGAWSHTPSNLTLLWLAVSLPLVMWDTGYVLLRPHSMPGGFLHAPIWSPYELYGRIDYVYGKKAWDAHNGWTAAQGLVNALETAAYLVYLYIVYAYGQRSAQQGRGAPDKEAVEAAAGGGVLQTLSESRTLTGKLAAAATVLCYSTALITFWKTVLYWLIEAFSGFESIGHNDWSTLLFLWIIPNGAWLVFPAYMIYVFGAEILEGLEAATTGSKKTR